MLVEYNQLLKEYKENLPKLERIVEIRTNAPSEYKLGTDHLSTVCSMFSYLYHTALVKKCIPASSATKMLDWGSFLGQVSYILQNDYSIYAHNPKEDTIIKYWQDLLNIKNRLFGDMADNESECIHGCEDESFDAVISSGVLEHTFEYGMNDTTALRCIYRLLRQDGLLFIWHLPTSNAFAEILSERKKRWRHILRYKLHDILVKLSISGFTVLQIEKNELLFDKLSKIFTNKVLPIAWSLDHLLCRLPMLRTMAHHYTIVAAKVSDFPRRPCNSNYNIHV